MNNTRLVACLEEMIWPPTPSAFALDVHFRQAPQATTAVSFFRCIQLAPSIIQSLNHRPGEADVKKREPGYRLLGGDGM